MVCRLIIHMVIFNSSNSVLEGIEGGDIVSPPFSSASNGVSFQNWREFCIEMLNIKKVAGSRPERQRWPGGVVLYEFASNISSYNVNDT